MIEEQASEAQRKFMSAVDNAVKNAPAGSENAVALVKSAVAAANNAYESVHKAAKQAADVAEANFQTITARPSRPASKPPPMRSSRWLPLRPPSPLPPTRLRSAAGRQRSVRDSRACEVRRTLPEPGAGPAA